jgi:formamidopyrimidine-DNA glycosylase
MRRAIAGNGAVLISQDGYNVHYRKKCSQCGFEDTCRSTMLISIGTTRSHFFCPKCRKNREVQIQGCMQ